MLTISTDISMVGIALKMFLVVTVPVIIGMIIRILLKTLFRQKLISLIN